MFASDTQSADHYLAIVAAAVRRRALVGALWGLFFSLLGGGILAFFGHALLHDYRVYGAKELHEHLTDGIWIATIGFGALCAGAGIYQLRRLREVLAPRSTRFYAAIAGDGTSIQAVGAGVTRTRTQYSWIESYWVKLLLADGSTDVITVDKSDQPLLVQFLRMRAPQARSLE